METEDPDEMEWITYNPIKYTPESFEPWMEIHRPSVIRRDDGVAWIAVYSALYYLEELGKLDRTKDLVGLGHSWETLQSSSRPVNLQTIIELAKMHNCLSGKWMLFSTTGAKVDILWGRIASAVVSNKLYPCKAAKVAPYEDTNNRHVICTYNDDFTNVEEVWAAENKIRSVGIKGKLLYKPDVYTHIGIYKNNEWGIRPVIYESVYDILSGQSKITSL